MVDMTDPAAVLTTLNQKLKELLSIGQFATMFYAVLNTFDETLTYAAAGSTNPAITRENNNVEWLDGKGMPLGASLAATYQNHSVPFQQGDGLLLYSDALIETPNSDGENISTEKLETILSQSNHTLAFNKILAEFKNHGTATDDLTIVLLSR